MSKKDLIYETVSGLGYTITYSQSTASVLPKIVMAFVSANSRRLSGKKHNKNVRYQLMYYAPQALDVEADDDLLAIESALEDVGLITTDWMEITDVDEETELGYFNYLIEVI